MFDHKPQEPLLKIAANPPPESFETRVLRELAAIGERLAKLEEEMALARLLPAPIPYFPMPGSTGRIVGLPDLFDDDGKPIPGAVQRRANFYQGVMKG
jgi:hypothetical protein